MIVRWQDAYNNNKGSLDNVKSTLGKICICETRGKVVYRDNRYTIIEQNYTPSENTGDYFVIPTSLIIGRRRKQRKRK